MADKFLSKITNPSGREKVWRLFALVIILAIGAFLIVAGRDINIGLDKIKNKTHDLVNIPHAKEIPFRLGLDLSGGTRLVYNTDTSAVPVKDRTSAIEGARDVIERRVNVFGVSEPLVQTDRSGDTYRINVELAGIKDVNEAIKMIGETPLLEFKEENTEIRKLTADEKKQMDTFNKNAENKATEILGKLTAGGDFAALAKQYSEDEATKEKGGDLGYVSESENPNLIAILKKMKVHEKSKDLIRSADGFEMIRYDDKRTKTDPFNNNQPQLEASAAHLLICFTGINDCQSGLSKDEALKKINELKAKATPQNFSELVKQNSTEPGAQGSGGELGWFGKGKMVKSFEDAVFAQKVNTITGPVESEFGYHLIFKKSERKLEEYKASHILIKTKKEEDIIGKQSEWKNTELSGRNLKRSTVEFNPNTGQPEVSLEFDDDGAKKFADITGRNVGKPVAIYLDNYAISQPKVNEKITGGKAVISGSFNIAEAKLLAQRLNAGALPIPITLVNQQTVGASLGQQSISDSLRAGIYGLLLVSLFMILFYRFPGLISVCALIIYGLLVLAVFKLWPITLSLAGLAGFILSIGMAVDANILIFARLKEELKKGKPFGMALEEGFNRAWPSIRDSNSFTIITCVILIIFTTSAVKGFAVTLIIGVLISMFSAIFITRNFLKLIPIDWLEKRNWLIGIKSEVSKE
jgi:protein-export membrane protein SecD